ncbi:hypothetical protein [Lentzea sp. E54]|uniref:hypothetical protein n=1 Tax=Lentzea xerophila TaxID=3435883 RepID=UPI003DA1DDF3
MGVVIAHVGVSESTEPQGSTAHAAVAVARALDGLGVARQEIDVLLDVGVYRDSNVVEPANAALVQKAAGLNLDFPVAARPMFSFDLINGACGLLNAVQVARSLTDSGTAERVLVVAADGHPSGQQQIEVEGSGFAHAPAAAALVLERAPDDRGFGPIAVRTADSDHAASGHVDIATMGSAGRSTLTVRHTAAAERAQLELATDLAIERMREEQLSPDRTLLLAGTPFPSFANELAWRIGTRHCQPRLAGPHRTVHTAALGCAYDEALRRGLLDEFDHLLFVTAGAGVSAACGSYRIGPS